MNRLIDKVAVITGAGSETGAAIARLFADEGAQVVLTDTDSDRLTDTIQEIEEADGVVVSVPCDLASPKACDELIAKTLENFGRLDILVNNASIIEGGLLPLDKARDEDIEKIIDQNLKGTMYLTRAALREMESADEDAAVVTITSLAGLNGCGPAAFAAGCAGLLGLTRHVAMRYSGKNIRSNAVCTDELLPECRNRAETDGLDPDMVGPMLRHLDMKAPVSAPEDVANIALFLASNESRALTGQILVSDFGASL